MGAILIAFALLFAGGCTSQPVRDNPSGVYALEPVDENRIPVLFVHGINDSPARFSYLIEHLDRSRFQPWFYSYPSDAHLATVADDLHETVLTIRRIYPFRSMAIVGHSMGGLVSRGFILRQEQSSPTGDIPLFVSISTPWDGHAAAARGVRFAPNVANAWYDMTPGSDYLKSLFEMSLPTGTRHYLLFTFNRNTTSFGASSDGKVTVASQLATPAQREAQRVVGFDDTHVGILQNPQLASLLNQLLTETFPGPEEKLASSPGSSTRDSPEGSRTERQGDQRNAQDYRIARDDPEQRQRSRPRSREDQDTEYDRNDSRKDQPQLASYLLAKPDCAEDLQEARRDRPKGDVEQQHEPRHRGMHECENADHDSRNAGQHQEPPVFLLLAAGKSGDQRDRAVDEHDGSEEQRQGNE
jgi:pimeloyl-ACP methyl ester carboxylesterase